VLHLDLVEAQTGNAAAASAAWAGPIGGARWIRDTYP